MTNIRVTAGSLRNRRIPVPEQDVRPTSERARQAFFNIVSDRIHDARFLDLFAGSGAFSFEAVSRGAAFAMAIDSSRKNIATIERLAKEWNANVRAVAGDVFSVLKTIDTPLDLAYADPPYDFARYEDLLHAVDDVPFNPEALIAIEHRRRTNLTEETRNLYFVRRAEYGEVWISIYAPKADAAT